jgi:membrane protein YqaA with SNARE-associated domain
MQTYLIGKYFALFINSFLAATLLPIVSEPLLIYLLSENFPVVPIVICATIGNSLGSYFTYYLGYLANWQKINKWLRMKEENILKVKRWIDKYGVYTAFFAWIPFLGDPIALALGVFKINVKQAFLFIFIGKLLRYSVVAGIYLSI